jgi:hypothetical protein
MRSASGGERHKNARTPPFVTATASLTPLLRAFAVAAVSGAPLALATRPASALTDPASACRAERRADPRGRETTPVATIMGVVRSGDLGVALPGARVEVPELNAAVCSDSAGAYQLSGLPAGTVTVRVTRRGYDTVSVLVTVTAPSVVRVDITLSPQAVVLDSVQVRGSPAAAGAMPFHDGLEDGDTWAWRGDPGLSLASTGEPDVMRTLSADPHLALHPDSPGSLMDRGGSSDQLLVRVDGLPVWSPVHGSGTLSVITPDAIGSLSVHDGAIPADIGDRLGGVLDIDTRAAPVQSSTGAASLGPGTLRATWARPLDVGEATGGVRLAFRHSDDDLLTNDAGPIRDHWNDGVATVDMATGPTTVRLVFLASNDLALPYGESFASNPAAIPWSTGTLGVVWAQRLGAETALESHVSIARFGATVPAAADGTPLQLDDGVLQTELTTQLSWRTFRVGASLDVLNVSYKVTDAALPEPMLPPLALGPHQTPLALVGTPLIAAAFVERQWGPADSAWRITTGLRGMALPGMTARLEPRASGALRLMRGVIATIGYARTHQAVQSLRNPESPLGSELGVDLPVVTGTGGVPLAQSDVGTAGIVASLGAVGRLSVDGYVRNLSGLAVADPMQPEMFATTGFARAWAHVDGLAAQLNGAHGRVAWQVGYGVGRTIESVANVSYHPPSQLGETGSAAIGIAVDRLTQVRLAGWAGFGQRAPGLDGTVPERDDEGDVATATATPLPAYLRADLQLAHVWQVGPARGRLSTYVTLANMFNHANIAGQFPTGPGGPLRTMTLLPRTLLFGIGWAY